MTFLKSCMVAVTLSAATISPLAAQGLGKTVAKTTSGGVVAVGSNNGNGNGNAVSNSGGGGRAPIASVGSNNGNGNGNQVTNSAQKPSARAPVGNKNGNGNGNAIKNCGADDGGSGMMGGSPC